MHSSDIYDQMNMTHVVYKQTNIETTFSSNQIIIELFKCLDISIKMLLTQFKRKVSNILGLCKFIFGMKLDRTK